MRFIRPVVALICAIMMTGCGSGGIFNLNPQPDGNIVITNAANGATLQTTLAKPFTVSGGAFSIGLTENHFSGPFTVTVTAWTAPFNLSCYVSHYVDQTDKTNIVKFSADNASPVTAPTQPSPCNPFTGTNGATQTDEETATIIDGHGHTAKFYYQMAGATPTGGGGSAVPAKLAVSWSGPSPTNTACGAYVLNVGALNASGTAVATSASNPITLSTTGGGYMGFSVATASSAGGFTCPQNTGTGSPGGSPSLQLTTSPTQVLVYFNGLSAAASTTITASSVGLPPITLVIGSGAAAAPASLAVSWSGPSPTASACGAYVLNVSALNSSGTAVSTNAGNPITLSTTGGGYMGFSSATSAAAGFTCNGTPPVGSPGGAPTFQLTSSPAQVVVYFNGFGAAASTTITVSSVGVPSVTLTVAKTLPAALLGVSWNGPSPVGRACGAYLLNVSAVDASGNSATTTAANPITLSTTGGGYMGFSAATSAAAGFTCDSATPIGSPGGAPTLLLTSTPAQVLVYFNGFSAPASTTITASNASFSPATISIAGATTTVVASFKLSWNGAVPTFANCGAFNLNVQAFDSSGKLIVSSAYANPITLSTNSAIWSGFSTVTAGIAPAPAPAALTCGVENTSPPTPPVVGTPTLAVPDTATPTVVYYDGIWDKIEQGAAPTTISASAQGVQVQSLTIAF